MICFRGSARCPSKYGLSVMGLHLFSSRSGHQSATCLPRFALDYAGRKKRHHAHSMTIFKLDCCVRRSQSLSQLTVQLDSHSHQFDRTFKDAKQTKSVSLVGTTRTTATRYDLNGATVANISVQHSNSEAALAKLLTPLFLRRVGRATSLHLSTGVSGLCDAHDNKLQPSVQGGSID